MEMGKKGMDWGAGILIIAFIAMLIIGVISAAFQTGGVAYDPSSVVEYYKKLFSEENLKQPFALVITFFVPFISTFAITWAFIGVLPIFRDRYRYPTADRSAAVLALGLSLYTMPAMNFFITSFFPWSLAVAAAMIFIGLIGKALHWGTVPFVETAEGLAEAGRRAQRAWKEGKPVTEEEKREKEEYRELKEKEESRMRDLTDKWNSLLRGYKNQLERINEIRIDDYVRNFFSTTRDVSLSRSWVEVCKDLDNLERERKRAVDICNTMLQALQTPQEFKNLFKERFYAAGTLNEFQRSLSAMESYFDATIRDFENVLSRLRAGRFSSDVAETIYNFQRKINEYKDFFEFYRAPNNDIAALRTETIRTLDIR